jgi:hypothetical protein
MSVRTPDLENLEDFHVKVIPCHHAILLLQPGKHHWLDACR